ncbi:MAG TPA: SDR family NAD(P)-dependent oxidoreductase [Acidimicrobiales bacterium]|nr:SDR family NAD(P)-dependent oxidoreductase [Acidimicrobiales bacterium]
MNARSVVVTGASTGIGQATALRLADEGWTVFAGVRRAADADRLTADAARARGELTPILLDVTDEDQVESAFATIADTLGNRGLSALVNNAGTALGGPVEYLPLATWRDQFDVNVFGQITVTKAAMPLLRVGSDGHGGHGRIVFIGSNSGRMAAPMLGPYAASKFAVEGLADALRMELVGTGVSVVVIEPGAIATPIWEKGRNLADRLEEDLPAEALERYADLIAGTRAGIEMQDSSGAPPSAAADVVWRALNAKRPATRYQVGIDGKLSVLAARFLPDRLKDYGVRKFMKL